MTKMGVDPDCYELAGKFLGEAYKGFPPSKEEAADDLSTLSEQIQAAIDDWFFAKFDGERAP